MKTPTPTKKLEEFLRESNAIEGVFDDDSLKQARCAWEYLLGAIELNPLVILETHRILMLHHLMLGERGRFRQERVFVGGYEAPDWNFIPDKIGLWCEFYGGIQPDKNSPIIEEYLKDGHIEFEKIHPFIDGNGRTGRLLMNWQRVKAGLPILVIKEAEKQKYYDWFK